MAECRIAPARRGTPVRFRRGMDVVHGRHGVRVHALRRGRRRCDRHRGGVSRRVSVARNGLRDRPVSPGTRARGDARAALRLADRRGRLGGVLPVGGRPRRRRRRGGHRLTLRPADDRGTASVGDAASRGPRPGPRRTELRGQHRRPRRAGLWRIHPGGHDAGDRVCDRGGAGAALLRRDDQSAGGRHRCRPS